VPHDLTEANKKERVAACRENLEMFSNGKWRLYDVVTGDESATDLLAPYRPQIVSCQLG
jgi:hypothetical protein